MCFTPIHTSLRSNLLIYFALEEDQSEPPTFGLRSPPSDEGGLNNRVPGAFGDRANNQRNKKMPPKVNGTKVISLHS